LNNKILGNFKINNIYEINCLEGLKLLPNESIDLIITSPPYAERRNNTYGGIPENEYVEWFLLIAIEIKRVLKSSGSFFLNIKPHCKDGERVLYVFDLILSLTRQVGFRFVDEFTWTKNGVPGKFNGRFKNAFEPVYHFTKTKKFTHNPYEVGLPIKEESLKRANRKACGESLNGSGFAGLREGSNLKNAKLALPSNHLHIVQKSNQHTIESKHPAVFPLELPNFFIKAFSNPADIILDIFMGSGTTALAAKNNNRNFIGFETEKKYIDIANSRLKTSNLS
jgi:site-specific DNA-methyltransferase (adenine-specific)